MVGPRRSPSSRRPRLIPDRDPIGQRIGIGSPSAVAWARSSGRLISRSKRLATRSLAPRILIFSPPDMRSISSSNEGSSVVVERDGKIEWLKPKTSVSNVLRAWKHPVAATVDLHGRRGSARGCNRVQGAAALLAFTALAAM
jgi:hypothetical protein